MRVLICGDREWDDIIPIGWVVRSLCPLGDNATVIHGAARGADSIAARVAPKVGVNCRAFPADWDRYGKGAGPIRNQQMLAEGDPDVVFAFHDDIAASKGTRDMCERAAKAGRPVYVVSRYRRTQPELDLSNERETA